MVSTFLALDPSTRVPWYGPPMSLASSLTARIMETWAHGQDVFDALGAEHPVTAAVRHVAYLGVRTFGLLVRGPTASSRPPSRSRVVLTAPDGAEWSFGDPTAPDRVTGPALDFALVVTQRRHLADTALGGHRARGDAVDADRPGLRRAAGRRAAHRRA